MNKIISFIIFAVLCGYLISFYSLALIIFLGGCFLFLFFIKREEEALLFIVFFLPFGFALNPAEGIDLAANRVLMAAIFLVWLANSLARKKLKAPFDAISIFLALFFGLAAGSLLAADNTAWALRKLLVFASIFPLYWVVSDWCGNWRKVKKMLYAIIGSAVLAALIGLVQFFSQFIAGIKPVFSFWASYVAPYFYGFSFGKLVVENPSWLVNIGGATYLRALSLFPDPHMFAFYLGLVLPLIFSLIIFSLSGKSGNKEIFNNKCFLFVSFCVLLSAAMLTFSRSGYIGIFSAIVFMIIISWRYLKQFAKFAILASALSFLIMVFFTNNPVSSRFYSIADFSEGSNAGRLKIWREAVDVIDANLLTGVGLGNYSLQINPAADYRNSIYAHNAYIDIAAEMGIIAALVWCLLLIAGIAQSAKNIAFYREDFIKTAIMVGLAGSLVSFAVSSLADTALYSPAVLGMLMVILGLISGIAENNAKIQITNAKSNLNS